VQSLTRLVPIVLAGLALAVSTVTPVLRAQIPAVRRPLPVPDLPGLRTLKADFHLHTVFSDGNVWPTVPVQEAWRDGLDVIALTEHAEYHPHAADVTVDGGRSYAVAKPLADRLGILLVPGVEITKPDPPAPLVLPEGPAHFNALFVTDANALNVPRDLMAALRRAKAQGAFVFWNHPRYRVARAEWFAPIARAFDEGLFQGMELVNGPDFYEEAFPWIAERRLTILANSDAHDPIPSRARNGADRPITLLFVRTPDLPGVRDALDSRRTAAWLGDEVWGAEEHLRGLWTGAIVLETPALTRTPGAGLALAFRNTSAIPMRVRVRAAPDWLVIASPVTLAAEAVTTVRPAVTDAAPTSEQRIELQLDVENLHTGPGRSLIVTLPLTVRLTR
jgi:3',5'-nucleoside bisphosphate phosphatase